MFFVQREDKECEFLLHSVLQSTIIVIIINNILRGGLQSPNGGFQEGPLK